jgi:hypothetical protein
MFEKIRILSRSMVLQRWNIDVVQLKILVEKYGLKETNKGELGLKYPFFGVDGDYLPERYEEVYQLEDVQEFEQKYPELTESPEERGLRKDQRHRERCRAVAELMWRQDPGMTITKMAETPEIVKIACENKKYKADTIRKWINDLCPDRSPGRRPLENNFRV